MTPGVMQDEVVVQMRSLGGKKQNLAPDCLQHGARGTRPGES